MLQQNQNQFEKHGFVVEDLPCSQPYAGILQMTEHETYAFSDNASHFYAQPSQACLETVTVQTI